MAAIGHLWYTISSIWILIFVPTGNAESTVAQ